MQEVSVVVKKQRGFGSFINSGTLAIKPYCRHCLPGCRLTRTLLSRLLFIILFYFVYPKVVELFPQLDADTSVKLI